MLNSHPLLRIAGELSRVLVRLFEDSFPIQQFFRPHLGVGGCRVAAANVTSVEHQALIVDDYRRVPHDA